MKKSSHIDGVVSMPKELRNHLNAIEWVYFVFSGGYKAAVELQRKSIESAREMEV